MEIDGCYLNCSVTLEWINIQGVIIRKVNYRSAQLRLIRNNIRQILIQVYADKTKTIFKFILHNINILNRFMHEGKATIKFNEEGCTLFLFNAPESQLASFLKTIFIKITNEKSNNIIKNPLAKHLGANVNLGGTQDISPATTGEMNAAKERALLMATSRKTITTPSPSNIRKRKLTSEFHKVSAAKKLYTNLTIIKLTEEQNEVLEAVLKGKNIFFTGSAGTGKSYLLRRIIGELPPDVTTITASTGVAACHIGGITLHQFAGIGLGNSNLERCYQLASRPNIAACWRKTKYLIIDEISMIDGQLFDKIEAVARYIRKSDKPFGGIQLILCGDFFQLPPVKKNDEKSIFCFESKSWENSIHCNFELHTVHRQKDPIFIQLLNNIRIGRITDNIKNILKATAKQSIEKDGILATRLCSHIREADEINESQLNNLGGISKTYVAQDSDESMTQILNQQLSVPGQLILKVKAQVMLLKNINVNNGLVNGARGVITKFENDIPVVQFCSGTIYHAKSEKWTVKIANGHLISRKQIPLKLAWAFSIHKSQGLTLDCVEMNLSKVFDAGQAYVALSRAQSLETLRVIDFNEDQVWVHTNVLQFYKKLRRNLFNTKLIPLGKKSKMNN